MLRPYAIETALECTDKLEPGLRTSPTQSKGRLSDQDELSDIKNGTFVTEIEGDLEVETTWKTLVVIVVSFGSVDELSFLMKNQRFCRHALDYLSGRCPPQRQCKRSWPSNWMTSQESAATGTYQLTVLEARLDS